MRDVLVPQPELEIAAVEERRELPIAVAEVEDDRQRVVLLGVRHQEVQQEALAAAGRAEHERVPDVVDVQVEVVRRLVLASRRSASASRSRCGLRGSPVSSVKRKLRSA